ncbi:hypothetical protein ACFQ0M_38480 [Kitasatospora aburaviensis]
MGEVGAGAQDHGGLRERGQLLGDQVEVGAAAGRDHRRRVVGVRGGEPAVQVREVPQVAADGGQPVVRGVVGERPSYPPMPASRRVGARSTAAATSTAASTPRTPVRPPGPPSSTSTSTGHSAPAARSAPSICRTLSTESTQEAKANAGSAASSAASQPSPAGSSRVLASRIRRTPKARATRSCGRLARVMPWPPASSWACQSAGAIVVLPCGASATPALAHQSAMVRTLCSTAAPSRVSNGVPNPARVGPVAR